MTALFALTVANIRSYVRDRAALFWTLAFPLIFIFMFGFIFQEGGAEPADLGLGRRGRDAGGGRSCAQAFDGQEGDRARRGVQGRGARPDARGRASTR